MGKIAERVDGRIFLDLIHQYQQPLSKINLPNEEIVYFKSGSIEYEGSIVTK